MWIIMFIFIIAVAFYTGARTISLINTLFPKIGKQGKRLEKIGYIIFLIPIIGSFLLRGIGVMKEIRNFGFVCMAAFLYLLLFCLSFECVWGISKLIVWKIKKRNNTMEGWKKILAGITLGLAILVTGYGLYHARDLKVKEYSISLKANSPLSELKVILISDLHLGSMLDKNFVKQLVTEINSLQADVICIAGDIFDNDYEALKNPEETAELQRKCLTTDFFITSTNAMAEDGILVNIDGNGNRLAAICFGPKNVIVICGINKITQDLETAVSRARFTAAPINAGRFDVEWLSDDWTVVTQDHSLSAHYENTILITSGEPEILTLQEGETDGY